MIGYQEHLLARFSVFLGGDSTIDHWYTYGCSINRIILKRTSMVGVAARGGLESPIDWRTTTP